jgi:tocopherol cyclase
MFYALRRLYRPEFYQGPRRLARYFEGWYYKAVIDGRAFALIPGVSRAPDDPHAFIQYIDGEAGTSAYHRFPLDRFSFRRDVFEVTIDSSRFGLDGFGVELPELSCDLTIHAASRWPSTLLSPGTMGWYSFVPFMECRHGIVAMDAELAGTVDGAPIGGGRLYVEKDYGKSFPNAWVWLQSNTFESPGTSVTCSIANVPFVGGAFTGFLAGILHDGELYRFTTYTGARLEQLTTTDSEVFISIADSRKVLEIRATREDGVVLAAPSQGVMNGRVSETMRSHLSVRLIVNGEERFSGTGQKAGLEVVAPERLVKGDS